MRFLPFQLGGYRAEAFGVKWDLYRHGDPHGNLWVCYLWLSTETWLGTQPDPRPAPFPCSTPEEAFWQEVWYQTGYFRTSTRSLLGVLAAGRKRLQRDPWLVLFGRELTKRDLMADLGHLVMLRKVQSGAA